MDVREKLVEQLRWWATECERTNFGCQARKLLAEAADYIAHGVTVWEWISVKDRLPEPFVPVLVQMPGEQPHPTVREGFISKDGIWEGAMFRREPGEVTHWRPMPQPPKGE